MLLFKIFAIFSLVATLPSFVVFFRLNIKNSKSKFLKRYFWVIPIVIVLGLAYISFIAPKTFINDHFVGGWMIIIYLALITPRLLLSIVLLISWPFKIAYKGLTRPLLIVTAILTLIVELCIFYGVFIGRYKFEVKEFTYESAQLPKAFDNYRIAQISDIHIDSWKNNKGVLERFVKLVNDQKADMIVFTGDLVSGRTNELDGFDDILAKLQAKDGVFSILGNHDYGDYYRSWSSPEETEMSFQDLLNRQAKMGWILLNNEHQFIYKDKDSIALIGVENIGEPPFSTYGDLPKAIQGTEESFQLLLSHNPSHWRREVLPKTDINLMLSGHTHAMQLELFNRSPAAWAYEEWQGGYTYGDQTLYVNIGAGEVGIPLRFGAWPEITVITLKHKSK